MSSSATQARSEIVVEDIVKVWQDRKDTWLYVAVPDDHTPHLDAILAAWPRGFRSIPVTATINDHRWDTALFRYKDGTWALPLRTDVRGRNYIAEGDLLRLALALPA